MELPNPKSKKQRKKTLSENFFIFFEEKFLSHFWMTADHVAIKKKIPHTLLPIRHKIKNFLILQDDC